MLATDMENRASTEAVISYNKLAREYGQPRVTPETFHSHPFCAAFALMDREDIAQKRPLRTALVYSEVLNRPGHGFFVMLAEARGQSITESRQADEWTDELKKLREHYKKS